MIKKIITVFLLAFTTVAVSAESLHLWDANVYYTGTSKLYIGVDADADLWNAFSFDIALPEGFTLEKTEEGAPAFTFTSRIPSNFSKAGNYQEDKDLYSFYGYRADKNGVQPGTGPIMYVTLVAADGVADGTYQGKIQNIHFATKEDKSVIFDDATFNIHVSKGVAILDEDSTSAPTASSKPVRVEVKRTIKGGQWSTICLPFALSADQMVEAFGNDVQLSDYTGWEGTYDSEEDENPSSITVNFKRIDTSKGMKANHPYIIKTSKEITKITAGNVTISPEDEPSVVTGSARRGTLGSFIGNYAAGFTVPKATLFISNGKFWYSVGKTKMKAYRGYFDLTGVLKSYYDDNSSSAKVNFVFDDATGIKAIGNNAANTGLVYNLGGQLVSRQGTVGLPKGVYISEGRKIVVK